MSSLWLDIAEKSFFVAGFGLVAALTVRRASAAVRHRVLLLSLIGLLALPAAGLLHWSVPGWKAVEPVYETTSADFAAPAPAPKPEIPWLAIVWGAGALGLLMRRGVRYGLLFAQERRMPPVTDPRVLSQVFEICRERGRRVLLLEGRSQESPMTWGHFRPVLVLPIEAAQWSEERMEAVVLHELAHLERSDWLTQALGELATAVYWFNPFAWALCKRLALESEIAADDRVLGLGLSGPDYAGHLLGVLRDLRPSRSSGMALAMARPGRVEGRVRAILSPQSNRRPVRGYTAFGLLLAMSVVVLLIGAAAPTLEHAFAPAPPQVTLNANIPSVNSPDVKINVANIPEPASPPSPPPNLHALSSFLRSVRRTHPSRVHHRSVPRPREISNSVSVALSSAAKEMARSSDAPVGEWAKAMATAAREIKGSELSDKQKKLVQESLEVARAQTAAAIASLPLDIKLNSKDLERTIRKKLAAASVDHS